MTCTYCGKPIRKRFWFNPFRDGRQCDRFLCRLRTGHLAWGLGIKIRWKEFKFRVPYRILKR